MKMRFFIGYSLLMISTTLKAQSDTIANVQPIERMDKSVSIGYGIATAPQAISSYTTVIIFASTLGAYVVEEKKFSGAFTANIKIPISNKWKVGLEMAYETSRQTGKILLSTKTIKQKLAYLSFMPRVDYYWLDKNNVKLYSGLSFGGLLLQATHEESGEKKNYFYPAFQINALGVELGGNICFFTEGGFGNAGSLQAGLRIKFK